MKKSQKQGKNAFIEAHTATKRVWVMVLFIFFTLFLFGNVSALTIDNVKSYDEETKTITIKNAFGLPLFGSTIAEIRLETPIKNRVGLGYQKVVEMRFIAYKDFKIWFSTMELYDINNGMSFIERSLDFKYRVIKDIIVDDYKIVCSNLTLNGTQINCSEVIIGNHIERVEKWEDISKYVFVSGEVVNIGIFTDVKIGDRIEWIPTFYGKRVTEWAEWSSLDVPFANFEVFNNTGADNFTVPVGVSNVSVLVVAGGGGGGGDNAGGGGAGGLIFNNSYVVTSGTNINLFIGNGGVGRTVGNNGDNGTFTFFGTTNVTGGGGGGLYNGVDGYNGGSGGGGGSASVTGGDGGIGIVGQGNNGGLGQVTSNYRGGGGGGSSGVGTGGSSTGNGGGGTLIWGLYWSGGGGGGSSSGAGGTGGSFIGGNGSSGPGDGDDAIAQTGSGGGGAGQGANTGGDGASGVVIVAWNQSDKAPVVSLNLPVDNYNSSSQTIVFNGTAYDNINLTNVSLILDSAYNETNISGLNNSNYIFNKVLADGNYNWTFEACDNVSQCTNATTRDFMIDTTDPLINITTILNTTYTDNYSISSTINISLNWTVSDTNLDSCWYYNTTANVSITCGNNVTITLPYGGYTFIVYANDSVGHESSSNVTATWAYKLLQNSITYNADAFELSNEEFKINVSSTGEQTVASSIVYNGTSYSANKAGDNILMEFSRTIPIYTAGNNSFYWSFGYGSEIINSSTYFQNISETNLANCTNGTKYFNLLLKDEKTMEFLSSSNNISIETVFIYYINDISVNKTFVSSFNQNNVSFCLDPPIENVKVFGEISYDDDLHVKERHFILFESFTNSTTTNISLYNIAASESTSFLVFTETEGAPYPDVYMKLKRQYLNLNDFVVVEMAKADSFGQTVLHFVTEDEIYKIDFYDEDGNLVLTTQPFQAVCIDNVCSMSFKVDPEGGIIPPFQGISPDGNLVFTLSLVGNDTAVLLNYVSTNGSAYNLQMKTAGFSIVNDTVLVCTETQTNTISGSMSCNISSYPFTTYVTELWVDDVLNDIQYSSVINDAWKDFGNEGIIYTILIIMALTLLLIYTPELCVLGSIAGVLISAKFGFIPMTYVSGMYLVVAGIIIIFKMRKN
ncbi:MAG TPA: hypothetical protein ENI22_00675 [Candidatus Pacearchaeota archaeon]|nr:hypothetical protein [Candidatus Pacearchaeota archaeon]